MFGKMTLALRTFKRTFVGILGLVLAVAAILPGNVAFAQGGTNAIFLPLLGNGMPQASDVQSDEAELASEGGRKFAFVMTNAPAGNAISVYDRAADGVLTYLEDVATGGLGTGAGLGSQGGLILSQNNRWLFAVNAGSNSISSFEVGKDGLQLVGTYASNGVGPTSLTTSDKLLYVLNAGDSGNITGFWVNKGQLTPIPNSTRMLSNGGVGTAFGPAQIQFSARGTKLVVTERGSQSILTYAVDDGVAVGPVVNTSSGAVPFGFDIDNQDLLVVSEAAGGAGGPGASSYKIKADGSLRLLSGSVSADQRAACWLVISKNGRYAYVANAASNTLSSYTIGNNGSISVLNADISAGTQPLDMDLSTNGKFLYVINGRDDTIRGYRVNADGSLTDIGSVPVVATAVGIAAL